MHSDIEPILQAAEDHYLQPEEVAQFQEAIATLAQRLEVYEMLRDQEIEIFEPIVTQLHEAFPDESSQRLERALKHWISVLRYAAMGMLLNNREYLQRRLLEWLTDFVKVHQMETLEDKLYQFLLEQLEERLSSEQVVCVQPFLAQAHSTLLGARAQRDVVAAGQ